MHVGPTVFDSSVPVSAKSLHYHALVQRNISPEEARRWVAQEYNPKTGFSLLPVKEIVRPAVFALGLTALTLALTYGIECIVCLFQ